MRADGVAANKEDESNFRAFFDVALYMTSQDVCLARFAQEIPRGCRIRDIGGVREIGEMGWRPGTEHLPDTRGTRQIPQSTKWYGRIPWYCQVTLYLVLIR